MNYWEFGELKMAKDSMKKYVFMYACSKYSLVIINIFFAAVMTRILTPEDYGIVAVVTVFTTLFLRLSDMGFGTAVVQRVDLSNDEVNDIFCVTVYIGLILGLAFIILGFPLSAFYKNNVYVPVCVLLSVSVFFNSINIVPDAVIRREELFKKAAIRAFVVSVIGFIVALIMAVLGFKYYALLGQTITTSILTYLWNNHTSKLKFKLGSSIAVIKKIGKYGFFQFVYSFINYFETNADNILIGAMMGSTTLGYYDKAYKLSGYPIGMLNGVISPVLHPVLKNYQNEKKVLLKRYLDIQKLFSIISMIIVIVCFTCSREIITILFGSQWEVSILAFQMLSLSVYPRMMASTAMSVYCSIGNTKILARAGIINTIITALAIFLGITTGDIAIVALFVSIASWINMIVIFSILIIKGFKDSLISFFGTFAKDIAFMIAATTVICIVSGYVAIDNILISLLIKCIVAGVFYIAFLCLTGEIKLILRLFKRG